MKYRHRVLAFLSVFAIITFVDRVCISVAGKSMQEDLGLNPTQWGWILGSFVLAYGLFEIPTGALGDRIGPRRVLTRIVVWWSAFTSLTGLVSGFWPMAAVRFLFGAGEAGPYPNGSVAIYRWFPKVERARAQGCLWSASRLGGALAPLLVIPIQRAYGWRMSFYVFGLMGIGWAAAWYAWFRDSPSEKKGVTDSERAEIGPEPPIASHLNWASWRGALRQPNFWWLLAMYHTYCWSGFFYLTWFHSFLENARGFDKGDLVRLSWLPFVFGAIANILGGLTSDALVRRVGLKWGRRAVGLSGLGLSTLFIAAALCTQNKVATVLFLALGYGGSDFMMPAAWAFCLDIGGRHVGAVTGAMNSAGQAGSFLTTVAFGYMVSAFGSYDLPLVPIVVMSAISTLTWLKLDPTKKLFAEDPAEAAPILSATG